MKKNAILFSLVLTFLVVSSTYAQDLPGQTARTATKAAKLEARVTQTAANQQTRIQDLKTRADTEIQRRVDALNKLIARIGDVKKLSAEQKTALQTQIQTQVDGLNTLKTKIDADTDLVTLKNDVQSIVTDYRIFAFFIQNINLLAASERITVTIANMSTVSAKLQIRLQEAKTKGKDVTALSAILADMQAKLNSATTLVAAASTELVGLTAQGYPNNKVTLMDAKTKLQSVSLGLKTAGQDARQIIDVLRGMAVKPHPSEPPTSSSSATPRT